MKRITVIIYTLGCYATFLLIFGEITRFDKLSHTLNHNKLKQEPLELKTNTVFKRHLASSMIVEPEVTEIIEGKCLPTETRWCQSITEGNEKSRIDGLDKMERNVCNLTEYLKNCNTFKSAFGYSSLPVVNDEHNFQLAYSLMVYENVEQTEQILRNIYRQHNLYCIHVDKKADYYVFETLTSLAKCLDNVIIIQDREFMVHSSFSYVKSELKCMSAALTSSVQWKYYINIAENEFPLRTNLEMVRILNLFKGANDIETYNHPVFLQWKLERRFSVYGNSLAEEGSKDKFKYRMNISRGNPKGAFSRDFVRFILEDDIAKELLTWFEDTYDPAENVWATLVTLPWAPGNYPVEVRHLIHTFGSRAYIHTDDSQKCQGRIVRNMCYFVKDDFPWLLSRPELIAGNFNDAEVVDCLEQHYRHRAVTSDMLGVNWKYFVNLPHVKYHWKHLIPHKNSRNPDVIKKNWIKDHLL